MLPEKARWILLWLRKANKDFRRAQVLSASDPTDLEGISFNYQQATEKYLNAWLSYHELDFKKTHSVESLLHLLAPYYQATDADFNDAETLLPYAVEFRYPSEEEVEPDLAVIRAIAERFRALVFAHLGVEPSLAEGLR